MDKPSTSFRINHLPPFHLSDVAQAVISARSEGRDIIDLSQLNPSLSPPSGAVEKLVQASLQPHNHRYSSSQGISKLREAVANWYHEGYQVSLDKDEQVLMTLGTKQAVSHLLMAVVQPGDTLLLPTPAYPIHTAAIVLSGAHLAGVPLPVPAAVDGVLDENNEEFFSRLVATYESTWPRAMMMLLSFPHNPTALVVTLGFFERLVALAKEKGFYLVHDFAYADLGFDGYRPPSLLQAPGAMEVGVEMTSFSKGLSMPGWRIGTACGNPQLVQALKRIKGYFDCGIFQPLQIGALSALKAYSSTLAEARDIYQSRRDCLTNGLRELGFRFLAPKGSLFVWAELPASLIEGGSMGASRRLLSEANVAVSPGASFDVHSDGFLRFALGEPESRIRTALQSCKSLLVS